MPHGWKDYTMPVTVEAVTVETLPVDIKAQTIAALKIDVAAQTLPRLNVNIAASAVALNVTIVSSTITLNVKTAAGEHVDADIVSSITLKTDIAAQSVGNIGVDIKAQTLPQLNVNITASAITLNVNIASSSTTLNVNLAACAVTLNVNIAASAVTLNVKTATGEHVDTDIVSSITLKTDIVAQSVGNIGVDIKAQTLSQLNVNIAACAVTLNVNIASSSTTLNVNLAASAITLNVNIAASAVTLNVKTAVGEHVDADIVSSITLKTDIVAQSVGNIGVDIKAQTLSRLNVNIAASAITLDVNIKSSSVTLNVNIASSSATLNVCIASQTVDVNVKTSSGANIVIDKLTQSAYTERRFNLRNDNGVAGPTAPPYYETGVAFRGKFFPRGMRGMMHALFAYCKRTGTGTLTLAFSPEPGMGEVGSVVITPGTDWGWVPGLTRRFWNYDSLFVWVKQCSPDVSYGYDTAEPFDAWVSVDSGVTWTWEGRRYFFYMEGACLTVGDIPVSGTVNTVEIPSVFSEFGKFTSPLVDGGTSFDILPTIYGCGVLTCFICLFTKYSGNVNPNYQILGIVVDGKAKEINMYDLAHPSGFVTNAFQPVSFSLYDDANQRYAFGFNFPIKFKRSLRIYAKNNAAAGNIMQAFALIGYELLS